MPSLLLTADMLPPGTFFGAQQWGIFAQGGAPVLVSNSVFGMEYSRDYRISDYPQEKGAFESYNKVKVPFQAKVTFVIAETTRAAFLNAAEKAVASLDLVTVVTPEISYPSANLTHYSYRRETRNGKTMISVDVWCEEVRVLGEQPATTQDTNGATTQDNGAVQTDPPATDTFAEQITASSISFGGGNMVTTGGTGITGGLAGITGGVGISFPKFEGKPVPALDPPT